MSVMPLIFGGVSSSAARANCRRFGRLFKPGAPPTTSELYALGSRALIGPESARRGDSIPRGLRSRADVLPRLFCEETGKRQGARPTGAVEGGDAEKLGVMNAFDDESCPSRR